MARYEPGLNKYQVKAQYGGRGRGFTAGFRMRTKIVRRGVASKSVRPNIIRGQSRSRCRFIQNQGLKRLGRIMAHQMKITMERPGFTRRFLDLYEQDTSNQVFKPEYFKTITGIANEPLNAGEAVVINADGTFSPFPRRMITEINENTNLITDSYMEVLPAEPKRKRVTVGQLRNLRPMYTVEGEAQPVDELPKGCGWELVDYLTLMIAPGPKLVVEGEVEVKTGTVNEEQQSIEQKE